MRTIIRILFFVLFLGVILFSSAPSGLAGFLSRTDPLLAVISLTGGTKIIGVVGGVTVLILSFFIRRFFCRWLCPMGFILNGCRRCGLECERRSGRFGIRQKPTPRHLARIGQFILAVIFLALFIGGIGLTWLDPTALFVSLVTASTVGKITLPSAAVILLGAATFVIPGVWCGGLCPCGAFSTLLWRIRCRILSPFSLKNPETENDVDFPPRRRFLRKAGAWTLFSAAAGGGAYGLKRLGATEERWIRPPGAKEAPFFSTRCARCGACVRSCPTGLLRLNGLRESLETPIADFRFGWCRPDCQRCAEVCPTGAIEFKTPDEKNALILSVIRFHREGCRLWHESECSVCGRECPTGAITFAWDEEEYLNLPTIDAARCNGCGRCLFVCPGAEGLKGFTAEPPMAER